MGKKNRNRGGSGRGRYDDMFDYASGNDEDYQYSYQDEIDSAEFVDVENSQKDSRSRETMPSAEKNTKSMADEERESWDFIKAKMDQSLSRLGSTPASRNSGEKTEKSSVATEEEKVKKPKGPSVIAVFFGKMKSFTSAVFKKTASIFKRKPKPEKNAEDSGKNKPEKKSGLSSKEKPEKKPGIASSAFSFLKKKSTTLTDAVKATRQKDEKTNASGGSTVSKGAKPTPETQLRERRKTYLIIGSITMSIVLLLLTAGILFIVNRSGKSGKSVAQNMETSVQTENSTETQQTGAHSIPVTTKAPETKPKEPENKTVPSTTDSDLPLPGLDDGPAEDLDQTIGDILNQDNSTSLADPTDLPAEEKAPEDDPLKISEKEEKTEEPLADPDFPPVPDVSPNTAEHDSAAGDVLEIPSLTDPFPETDPLKTQDSGNAPLQEETPSLNATTPETGEGDSANESSPSLLDLPESVSPGSTTVSPTLSRSEDQNQPPEEMGTPDGVTPGSNIESWNTPENSKVADSGPSGNSLDLDSLGLDSSSKKEAETAPKEDSLTAELALPDDTPSPKTSQPQEPKLEDSLNDLDQLSNLDSSPAPAPSLDSDLGSGDSSPSMETLKGQKTPKYTNYTSLKDDTFWKISEKFYQTPAYEKALSRYNSDVVPDPSNLKEGTVLQIPDVNFLRSCYPTLCPQPLQVVQVPTSSNPDQTRGVQYYCVAEGDTLSLIAERFLGDSSRWPEIYRMNASKIQEMDLVQPGLKLRIPADDTIPEQNIWQ